MSIINAGRVYDDSGEVLYIEKLAKFSEEEQIVGVWTNGKPVYSRTITGQTPGSNMANAAFLDSSIEALINAVGRVLMLDNGVGDYDWIFPSGAVYPYRRSDGVYVYNGSLDSAWVNRDYVMTIEYTKTTDAEGSGWKLLESGVSSSKDVYSEEETVVGTWIDGKPIYRIVRSKELALSGSTYLITAAEVSELNIDHFVSQYAEVVHGGDSVKNTWTIPYYSITSSSSSVVAINAFIGLFCGISRGFYANVNGNISMTNPVLWGILEYTKTTDTATS